MPRDEYWNGDLFAVYDYIAAEKITRQRRNHEMWIQGMYIYNAIGAFAEFLGSSFAKHRPQPKPYCKEPFPITEEATKAKKDADMEKEQQRWKDYFGIA